MHCGYFFLLFSIFDNFFICFFDVAFFTCPLCSTPPLAPRRRAAGAIRGVLLLRGRRPAPRVPPAGGVRHPGPPRRGRLRGGRGLCGRRGEVRGEAGERLGLGGEGRVPRLPANLCRWWSGAKTVGSCAGGGKLQEGNLLGSGAENMWASRQKMAWAFISTCVFRNRTDSINSEKMTVKSDDSGLPSSFFLSPSFFLYSG